MADKEYNPNEVLENQIRENRKLQIQLDKIRKVFSINKTEDDLSTAEMRRINNFLFNIKGKREQVSFEEAHKIFLDNDTLVKKNWSDLYTDANQKIDGKPSAFESDPKLIKLFPKDQQKQYRAGNAANENISPEAATEKTLELSYIEITDPDKYYAHAFSMLRANNINLDSKTLDVFKQYTDTPNDETYKNAKLALLPRISQLKHSLDEDENTSGGSNFPGSPEDRLKEYAILSTIVADLKTFYLGQPVSVLNHNKKTVDEAYEIFSSEIIEKVSTEREEAKLKAARKVLDESIERSPMPSKKTPDGNGSFLPSNWEERTREFVEAQTGEAISLPEFGTNTPHKPVKPGHKSEGLKGLS